MTQTAQPCSWALLNETGTELTTNKTETNLSLQLSVFDSLNKLFNRLSRLDYELKRKNIEKKSTFDNLYKLFDSLNKLKDELSRLEL